MGSYIEEVESLFLSAIRKGLCLRASDLELVRDWNAREIPLDVVSRGLTNGIRKFLAEAEPTAPLPSTLKYYRTSVEREFEVWTRASARGLGTTDRASPAPTPTGNSPGEHAAAPSLADRAVTVLNARMAAANGTERDAYARALSRFEAEKAETPLADLLFRIEDMLVTDIGQSLTPDVFKTIRDGVDDRMRQAEARGVGRRALEDLRRNGLRRAVAEHVGFDSFIDEVLKEHRGQSR